MCTEPGVAFLRPLPLKDFHGIDLSKYVNIAELVRTQWQGANCWHTNWYDHNASIW